MVTIEEDSHSIRPDILPTNCGGNGKVHGLSILGKTVLDLLFFENLTVKDIWDELAMTVRRDAVITESNLSTYGSTILVPDFISNNDDYLEFPENVHATMIYALLGATYVRDSYAIGDKTKSLASLILDGLYRVCLLKSTPMWIVMYPGVPIMNKCPKTVLSDYLQTCGLLKGSYEIRTNNSSELEFLSTFIPLKPIIATNIIPICTPIQGQPKLTMIDAENDACIKTLETLGKCIKSHLSDKYTSELKSTIHTRSSNIANHQNIHPPPPPPPPPPLTLRPINPPAVLPPLVKKNKSVLNELYMSRGIGQLFTSSFTCNRVGFGFLCSFTPPSPEVYRILNLAPETSIHSSAQSNKRLAEEECCELVLRALSDTNSKVPAPLSDTNGNNSNNKSSLVTTTADKTSGNRNDGASRKRTFEDIEPDPAATSMSTQTAMLVAATAASSVGPAVKKAKSVLHEIFQKRGIEREFSSCYSTMITESGYFQSRFTPSKTALTVLGMATAPELVSELKATKKEAEEDMCQLLMRFLGIHFQTAVTPPTPSPVVPNTTTTSSSVSMNTAPVSNLKPNPGGTLNAADIVESKEAVAMDIVLNSSASELVANHQSVVSSVMPSTVIVDPGPPSIKNAQIILHKIFQREGLDGQFRPSFKTMPEDNGFRTKFTFVPALERIFNMSLPQFIEGSVKHSRKEADEDAARLVLDALKIDCNTFE